MGTAKHEIFTEINLNIAKFRKNKSIDFREILNYFVQNHAGHVFKYNFHIKMI